MSGEAHPIHPAPGPDPAEGEILAEGRFRLTRRIGEGGMGEVWVADQVALGRAVALKLLLTDLMSRPDATARFEQEARSLSRVEDDHIVRVYDFGRDPVRGLFLATELLEGESLAQVIGKDRRLDMERAVRIVAEVLEGLEAAHAAGIVHRDLKPSNVMLIQKGGRPDFVKILDFGIAKVLEGPNRVDLTDVGVVCGTPAYLSPEQALALPIDHRADLYAAGVMLFRALAGRLPFQAENATALAIAHATSPAPPLPPDAGPPELAQVVARALKKGAAERFPDARTMREAMLEAAGIQLVVSGSAPRAVSSAAHAPAGPPPAPPAVARTVVGPAASVDEASLPALPAPAARRASSVAGATDVYARALSLRGRSTTRTVLALAIEPESIDGLLSLVPPPRPPATPGERAMQALATRLELPARHLGPRARAARQVIEAFGGTVIALTERLMLAAFGSPTDTLQCAAAVQDSLQASGVKGAEQLRIGVTAGEVVELQNTLVGAPVTEAETLAKAAAPGEVRFSNVVYLGMTKSEVRCEELPDQSARAFKLLRGEAPSRPDLPFGGQSLPRLERNLAAVRTRSFFRAMGLFGFAVFEKSLLLAERAAHPFVKLARGYPKLALLLLAFAIGGGIVGGRTLLLRRSNKVEQALTAGKKEQAVKEARTLLGAAPTAAMPHVWLALALAESHQSEEAIAELRRATELDPSLGGDPIFGRAAVRAMDREDANAARAFAVWVGQPLAPALLEGTRSERYHERWNAVKALEQLGLGSSVDRVEIYALDIEHASACKTRQRAVKQLVDLDDARAVQRLGKARAVIGSESDGRPPCNSLPQEIDQAIDKLSKSIHAVPLR